MKRYALKAGEPVAIKPDALRRDADGMFFMLGPGVKDNETAGDVQVVHIRGALAHYEDAGTDSYESILERVSCALKEEPSAVLFRIESPGGVVAGLNETVLKLRKMSKDSGVPFVAYVDEMAASAAYAMCCACEEIYAPASAIVGSVGVISTMVSQARADEMMGIDYELITSGTRKADGHVHAPITEGAIQAEAERNAELADQFFSLVTDVRPVTPAKLESMQAAIYLGAKARKRGLIDGVMSYDDVLAHLDKHEQGMQTGRAPNRGNETDRRAKKKPVSTAELDASLDNSASVAPNCAIPSSGDQAMLLALNALIDKTQRAIAAASSPGDRAKLERKLASYERTRRAMGGEEDDEDDEEDDSKAKMAAKKAEQAAKKAEAAKHRSMAAKHKAKAAEYEDMAKKAEEDDEEEAEEESESEASAAVAPAYAGMSPGAAAAQASLAKMVQPAMARIEMLEKSALDRDQSARIAEALAARRITPGEAKTLAKKDHKFVVDFLEMRPNAIVNVDDSALRVPDGTPNADLGASVLASIDQAIVAANLQGPAADKMREALVKSHRERMANANGSNGGRY